MNQYDRAVFTVDLALVLLMQAGLYHPPWRRYRRS